MTSAALRLHSSSPSDTKQFAARLAPFLGAGDLILLGGDLGAGKTTFTQGLAQGLGVAEPVTSPTFTLVRSYRTTQRFELLHADVYRLERLQEVIDLGLAEMLEEGAVGVVEWGERAAAALPAVVLDVHLQLGFPPGAGSDSDRTISIDGRGARWSDCLAAIGLALSQPGSADR
jgi:tRNA threonylcarbamoyladenosine biosynthesis protein TsaE